MTHISVKLKLDMKNTIQILHTSSNRASDIPNTHRVVREEFQGGPGGTTTNRKVALKRRNSLWPTRNRRGERASTSATTNKLQQRDFTYYSPRAFSFFSRLFFPSLLYSCSACWAWMIFDENGGKFHDLVFIVVVVETPSVLIFVSIRLFAP